MHTRRRRRSSWRTLLLICLICLSIIGLKEWSKRKALQKDQLPQMATEQIIPREVTLHPVIKGVLLFIIIGPLVRYIWNRRHEHRDIIR